MRLIKITLITTILLSSAYADDEHKQRAELLISGSFSPTALERIGKPSSVLGGEELKDNLEPSIGELLAKEPGVKSSYFGPGASRPIVRGQARERVRIVENGLELGDASRTSDDHAISFDPLAIDRIEVLRGPSTLFYGNTAIGGLVNIIDKSIAEENVNRDLTGEVDLRKGNSADDEISGSSVLRGQAGELNWFLSSFYRETDDIEIPGFAESEKLREQEALEGEDHEEESSGTLENSDTESKGVKIGGSEVWNDGFFGLSLKYYDSNYGVPGHMHSEEEETESEEESVRIDLEQLRMEAKGSIKNPFSSIKRIDYGLSYSDYDHKELEGGETGTKFENNTFEARIQAAHGHKDGLEGGIGTQITYEDFQAVGEEAFVPHSKTFSPALFFVEDYALIKDLSFQFGGRFNYTNIETDQYSSKSFNAFSTSTGLTWNPFEKDYTFGVNAAFTQRAPSATELYANGAHLATQSFEVGNSELGKEQAVSAEILAKKNTGRLTGSASLFWQHYTDFIALTSNGEFEDGLPIFMYDDVRARFWGYEGELEYHLIQTGEHHLDTFAQIDYVRAVNLSEDESLPRIPALGGKIGFKYYYANFRAKTELVLVNNQDKTTEFELPTDGYHLLNASLGYTVPTKKSDYEFYLRGTNLTNEEARVHTSFLKDLAPLRGRAILAGVRATF